MRGRRKSKLVTFFVTAEMYAEWKRAAEDNFQSFTDFATLAIGDAVEEYRERGPEDRRKKREPVDRDARSGIDRRLSA